MIFLHSYAVRAGLAAVLAATTGAAAGAQSAGTATAADSAYLTSTSRGSAYERAISEIGMQRGTTSTIRQYAQALVLDHASFNVNLMTLANKLSLVMPVSMSQDDEKRVASLLAKPAASFDTAFLAEEASINAKDVSDEQKELGSTQNVDVKNFVSGILEGDRFHLMLAQQLMHGQT